MTFDLYLRASISPEELIAAMQEVLDNWPDARLHKNDVTSDLVVRVDDVMVGVISLLDAEVTDFTQEN